MSLEALPVELLDLICTFCSLPSIKSLRLTSRTLRNVANDHLLRPEVVAYFHRQSCENVRAIAGHPQIARAVRALCLQADRLEDYPTYEEWNERRERQGDLERYRRDFVLEGLENLVPLSSEQWADETIREARNNEISRLLAESERANARADAERPAIPAAELRECYEYYCRLVEDQDILAEGEPSTMRECYAAFFRGCPNLVTVEVTMAHCLRLTTTRKNAIFQKGLVIPHGDPSSDAQGLDAVTGLIQAAYDADFSPMELRLASVTHYLTTEEDLVEEAAAFLRNVEVLSWQLATPFLNDDLDVDPDEYEAIIEDLEGGNLATFLADAPHLRFLELEMPCNESGWSCPRLPTIVGANLWPNLTSFIISKIEANPDDLSDFLLRHDKLQLLQLAQVRLMSGDWRSCFSMFAGKLLDLGVVELRGRFENPDDSLFYWFGHLESQRGNNYERKIAKYILEGGTACPEVPEHIEGTDDEWESDDDANGDEQAGDGGGDGDEVAVVATCT
ncbi:uncharacterized protein RCC_10159 [Ramularia collo-cygni]|uniref:F-box domain-containing protein n=1 Tax=Ramularia collo-cygni TaxID=112498 RepID=A0A2D3VNF6_9PEZI|nr:uncharacterized protein RCC_10159 [Ramularia collo-cygni]CZT24434.1 uncharacterized protein RCC_10159 [Ramularia collo-cygni]